MIFMEEKLNKVALKVVEDVATNCWEICDGDPSDHWRRTALGYIAGIVDMTNALKRELTLTEDKP